MRRMNLVDLLKPRPPDGRYVINSLPKSGTHLLARIFDLMGYRQVDECTLTYGQFAAEAGGSPLGGPWYQRLPVGVTRTTRVRQSQISRALDSVPPGSYVLAHLPFHAEWPRVLTEHGFEIVTITRDPRDVVVSNVDAASSDPNNWLHPHFSEQLPSRWERLVAMTEGTSLSQFSTPCRLEPLATRIRKILPWLERGVGLHFRFEDLVGPRGGGDEARQLEEITRLTGTVLGSRTGGRGVARIARKAFGRGSRTFNRGRVGRWRDEFPPALIKRWDGELADLTLRLGYPWCVPVDASSEGRYLSARLA
jgi:hypothetical protein